MKKFFAMFLAVVMVFTLGASALAVDTNDTLSSFTFTDFNLTVSVSTTNEGLVLNGTAGNRGISLAADTGRDIPQSFSLIFSNANGTDFDTSSVTVTTTYAATFAFYEDAEQEPGQPTRGYGIVALNGDSTTITITRTGVDGQCSISVPAPTEQVAGQGLVAYLPGAGQFVNEGADGSGWGGPYTSSTASTLKNLVEGYVTTGVSLGAFGGYAVLDFGEIVRDGKTYVSGGIYNDPNNAYGVDFTLFGNAMSTWAEPGCVQVSQDGVTWYDIAGSLHYQMPNDTTGGAIWDYSVTYTNPIAADDDLATGSKGTSGSNVAYTATYKARPTSNAETESGEVLLNNWHQHNYFPLYKNYFASTKTGAPMLDGLLHPVTAGLSFAGKFGNYTQRNGDTAATLELKGVKLVPPKTTNGGNSTAPDAFLFGYFDCHPNGLRSGAQVDPYSTGRTGNTNSNGDPIDISWAVYPAGSEDDEGNDISGHPVYLDAIRYVRCYTGVMQMNGIMGESSSELLGSHKATTKGAGAAQTAPTVTITVGGRTYNLDMTGKNLETVLDEDLQVVASSTGAETYTITVTDANASHIFINGEAITSGTAKTLTVPSDTGYVQIITQTGDRSPFIAVIEN